MKATNTALVLITTVLLALATVPVHAQYAYNRALQLDGNGDYVEVNTTLTITRELVVEAWVKTRITTGEQAIIARYNAYSNSNLDDQFMLGVRNGKASFQVNPGNLYVILDGNTFVADGQWHHIVGVYSSDSNNPWTWTPYMELYVDGSYDNSRTVPVPLNTSLNNVWSGIKLRIGALYNNGAPGFFFHGLIDEVRLWDKLSDAHNYGVFNDRRIPLRNSSGAYPFRAAWRFNGYPDSGFNAAFVGNAVEVPVSDLPVNTDSALVMSGAYFDQNRQYHEEYLNVLQGSPLTTNTLTIEAQVRALPSGGGQLQSVVSKFRHNSNSITDDSYFLGIEPNGVARFQISVGNNWHMVQGTTNLLDGGHPTYRWHHLAGVFTGTQLHLYVDGQLEASGPLTGSLPSNTTPLYIGASQEGANGVVADFFHGILDDVRLWAVARSAAQISSSANGVVFPTTGLVARWLFEGDFINIVNYRSGNPQYWATPAGVNERVRFCGGTCPEVGRPVEP